MLSRRHFLQAFAGLSLAYTLPRDGFATSDSAGSEWRTFDLKYQINLKGEGSTRLWLPMPLTQLPYQEVISSAWSGNAAHVEMTREAKYGATSLYAQWGEKALQRELHLHVRVKTRERRNEISNSVATPEEVGLYLQPTPHMPLDGIVAKTAAQITQGVSQPRDRARAIYNWVIDNTFRDPNVQGCGVGNIADMLASGNLGGKCADINALFVGLARASGIPAREVYGIRVADSAQFKCLGKSGDVSKAQHCRAEFYLPTSGWIAVDPADVRKVVLEEKLSLTDLRVQKLREDLFGGWEMNWVAFNRARDFTLQPDQGNALNYFMYPYALTDTGSITGIHPEHFAYKVLAMQV
jgi:transglutaminase-like putative cysteine protease